MKLATIIIGLLLISALFLTACQETKVEDDSTGQEEELQGESPEGSDIDLVSDDEVEIGELI